MKIEIYPPRSCDEVVAIHAYDRYIIPHRNHSFSVIEIDDCYQDMPIQISFIRYPKTLSEDEKTAYKMRQLFGCEYDYTYWINPASRILSVASAT